MNVDGCPNLSAEDKEIIEKLLDENRQNNLCEMLSQSPDLHPDSITPEVTVASAFQTRRDRVWMRTRGVRQRFAQVTLTVAVQNDIAKQNRLKRNTGSCVLSINV